MRFFPNGGLGGPWNGPSKSGPPLLCAGCVLGRACVGEFSQRGSGRPGNGGPWENFLIRAFHFLRRVRICLGSAFPIFPRLVWEGALGHFPDQGPDFYAQGAHLRASWDKNCYFLLELGALGRGMFRQPRMIVICFLKFPQPGGAHSGKMFF